MELIKRTDSKYEEYETLLLERDQVQKEAGAVWTWYIKTFGQLISDVYEEKLECVKCKKIISYYQAALNHGGIVSPDEMKKHLDKEMASYYANLKRMQKENDLCRNARQSPPSEVQLAKTLYRRLAKLLHPDINPETDRQEKLRELWQRIAEAYAGNDVKALAELEVLTGRALKELGAGEIKVEIPDIEDRIEALKEEIYTITHTEPYIYRDLYKDQEAVSKKTSKLSEELDSCRKYHNELDEIIRNMEQGGGIKFQWLMT